MLWLAVLAAACLASPRCGAEPAAAAPTADPSTSAARSVSPGVNERYLDPDLNPEEWVQRFEVESREVFRARRVIAAVCGLGPGERVADLGAGTGLFTVLFARQVGPDGRVFAMDIAPKFVERIGQIAAQQGLTQVKPTLVGDRDREYPVGPVDCVFVCDVYHHFEFPSITNRAIYHLLRPGGRLVVVDFERIEGVSREFVLGHVRAGKSVFRKEIQAAGFEFVKEHQVEGLEENYCLEFRRPAAGAP